MAIVNGEANARRITAAPEMEAVLERIAKDGRLAFDPTWCAELRAALAKAKGETPKFSSEECMSPVCSAMTCSNCGECPNRCGFDQDELSPHDECAIAKAKGE